MFKPGDKIIFIGDSNIKKLILHKTYTAVGFFDTSSYPLLYKRNFVFIDDHNLGYDDKLFISLKEYRKQKLEKLELCLKQEIK